MHSITTFVIVALCAISPLLRAEVNTYNHPSTTQSYNNLIDNCSMVDLSSAQSISSLSKHFDSLPNNFTQKVFKNIKEQLGHYQYSLYFHPHSFSFVFDWTTEHAFFIKGNNVIMRSLSSPEEETIIFSKEQAFSRNAILAFDEYHQTLAIYSGQESNHKEFVVFLQKEIVNLAWKTTQLIPMKPQSLKKIFFNGKLKRFFLFSCNGQLESCKIFKRHGTHYKEDQYFFIGSLHQGSALHRHQNLKASSLHYDSSSNIFLSITADYDWHNEAPSQTISLYSYDFKTDKYIYKNKIAINNDAIITAMAYDQKIETLFIAYHFNGQGNMVEAWGLIDGSFYQKENYTIYQSLQENPTYIESIVFTKRYNNISMHSHFNNGKGFVQTKNILTKKSISLYQTDGYVWTDNNYLYKITRLHNDYYKINRYHHHALYMNNNYLLNRLSSTELLLLWAIKNQVLDNNLNFQYCFINYCYQQSINQIVPYLKPWEKNQIIYVGNEVLTKKNQDDSNV